MILIKTNFYLSVNITMFMSVIKEYSNYLAKVRIYNYIAVLKTNG